MWSLTILPFGSASRSGETKQSANARSRCGRCAAPGSWYHRADKSHDREFEEGQRRSVEAVAIKVTALARERGDDDADFVASYNILYRGESVLNVHGIGPITRYANVVSDPWVTIPRPRGVGMKLNAADVGATWTSLLAQNVFQEFGLGFDDVARVTEILIADADVALSRDSSEQTGSE